MADNDIIKQNKTEITSPHGELFKDACSIIEQARAAAYRSVNDTLIKRNWLLGLRIQHEVLKDQRAEYGEQVIMKLAEELIDKYGRGFKKSNLYLFASFYQNHPDFFQLPIGKSLDMASSAPHPEYIGSHSDIYGVCNCPAITMYVHIISSRLRFQENFMFANN